MGKKLHRLDVGDGVHDLPGHHRPRAGAGGGLATHPRQEGADEEEIGDQPDRKRQRHPDVDRQQQQDRADDRGEREGDGVDRFAGDLGHRARRLHLLLRDAAGEVVVEEGDRLAERPAVQPRQHEGQDVRLHHDRVRRGAKAEGQRPQNHEENREAEIERPVGGEDRRRIGALGAVDDAAEEPGGDDLHRAGDGREHRRRQKRRPRTRQAPEEEPPQGLGRRSLRRAEGVDQIAHLHHSAASGSSSVPMKPPDCLFQNWA